DPRHSDLKVGDIEVIGKATAPVTIDVNTSGFQDELRRIINSLVDLPGHDGSLHTEDDDYRYTYSDGVTRLVSQNFKDEFMIPLLHGTDINTLLQTAATAMAGQVQSYYASVNGDQSAYQFGSVGAATTVQYQD